jgi:hypothetical protein
METYIIKFTENEIRASVEVVAHSETAAERKFYSQHEDAEIVDVKKDNTFDQERW